MLERTRLAVRRQLTMANLYESLAEVYGDGGREALRLAAPAGYRLFPRAAFTHGDCLRFTNLAAEALIRGMDLKKGERVLLLMPEPAEMLLASAALIKAGGIAVPLPASLAAAEIGERARGCGATAAVVDGRLLAARPELADGMPGVERLMASGPRALAPLGVPSLDAAMDGSSGFFIPYTLKPTNVVGLFHTVMGDGSCKAVMATNLMLLGPQRAAALLFPVRPGDACLCALPLETMAGFSAAVLALVLGMSLRFEAGAEVEEALSSLREHGAAAFMAGPELCGGVLAAGAGTSGPAPVRLWFSAGALPDSGGSRSAPYRPALIVEADDAGGNASVLALRPSLALGARRLRFPGVVIPPNRTGMLDERGRRTKRREGGESAVRGPAVTPGYWNDLEGTLKAKRDGWLICGASGPVRRAARPLFPRCS